MLQKLDPLVGRFLEATSVSAPEDMHEVDRLGVKLIAGLGVGTFSALAYIASKGAVIQVSNFLNNEPFGTDSGNPMVEAIATYANFEWARLNVTISGALALGSSAVAASSARLFQRCGYARDCKDKKEEGATGLNDSD